MTSEQPNVVILCLDSLRKDFYDDYAPRLQKLADVRFEEMRAMSSWSVPSHAAMFTGRLPRETGVHSHNREMSQLQGRTWLSDLDSYRTLGVSANVYASPVFGFDTLFDNFVSISRSRWFPDGLDVQEHIINRDQEGISAYLSFLKTAITHKYPVDSVLNGVVLKTDDLMQKAPTRKPLDFGARAVVRELEGRLRDSDEPVFAFANLMDMHTPHTPFWGIPSDSYSCRDNFTTDSYETWEVNLADGTKGFEREVKWFRQLYAATMSYVDRVVAEFIQRAQSETRRDTVFVVTADHGENLGYEDDGYLMHHSSSLSEGLLHVPFDIIGVENEEGTREVNELASHSALGEISRALANREPTNRFTTNKAEAELIGPSSEDYPNHEHEYWSRAIHAVYIDDDKYIRDELGSKECWDVSGPPCRQRKKNNIVPDEIFGISFEAWLDAIDATRTGESNRELGAAAEERLRQFGYL